MMAARIVVKAPEISDGSLENWAKKNKLCGVTRGFLICTKKIGHSGNHKDGTEHLENLRH